MIIKKPPFSQSVCTGTVPVTCMHSSNGMHVKPGELPVVTALRVMQVFSHGVGVSKIGTVQVGNPFQSPTHQHHIMVGSSLRSSLRFEIIPQGTASPLPRTLLVP